MTYNEEIIKYLKETLGIEPTSEELGEICNKEALVNFIKKGIYIEWEWTVKISSTCYSCCQDGAKSWVRDNLNQIYIESEAIWSPNWQELE